MADQDFLYDDFFFPQSAPGVPTTIEARGVQIPIELKKGIASSDYEYAQKKSIELEYHSDGTAGVKSVDQELLGRELIKRCVKAWPFKQDGVMVEINDQNIADLDIAVKLALVQKVTSILNAVRVGLNGPFVKPSGEAS